MVSDQNEDLICYMYILVWDCIKHYLSLNLNSISFTEI